MKRKAIAAVGIAVAATVALSACTGSTPTTSPSDGPTTPQAVTLTVSGWSLDTTPEFKVLADAFAAKHDNVTVELVQYDAAEYNTLVTTDLAARSGPDIITQKEVKFVPTFQEGGQLLELDGLNLPAGIGGVDSYTIDGTLYAAPYRQDVWVVFYNKDLYDAAGVDYPDGAWTWDEYTATLEALKAGLPSGVFPAYQHGWQSTAQGLSNAQSGVSILDGNFEHLALDYDRILDYQDRGLQIDFNTRGANQLSYQGEFGKQKAANLIMGTWYVATLISQQASGDADAFAWGIAPAPQRTATDVPVTFGDPTGFAINKNIDANKVDVAKAFLEFASSAEAATLLAQIGITPALTDGSIAETYFAVAGAPTDDLSKFAWSTTKTFAENPTSPKTAQIQGILSDLHSAILSGNSTVAAAIAEAQARVASEVG